jgi:hypothetical protein
MMSSNSSASAPRLQQAGELFEVVLEHEDLDAGVPSSVGHAFQRLPDLVTAEQLDQDRRVRDGGLTAEIPPGAPAAEPRPAA